MNTHSVLVSKFVRDYFATFYRHPAYKEHRYDALSGRGVGTKACFKNARLSGMYAIVYKNTTHRDAVGARVFRFSV